MNNTIDETKSLESEFPNGSIRLVEVEDSEPEVLETKKCSLCGMPFTVHPMLETNVVFCNFCTMHDMRSI